MLTCMRFARWPAALLLMTAAAAVSWRAQAPGPSLQQDVDQTRAFLCPLYALPPESCQAPMDVRLAATGDALPPGWGGLPSYAAGAAEPETGRVLIVISRCGPYPFGDVNQTLRHEISHVLLYRSLGFRAPRWLDEGLAMRASAEWGFSDEWYAAMALPFVARGSWRLSRVDADFAGGESQVRRSYALAKGFVRDLFKTDGDLTGFLLEARRDRSVDLAFVRRFGLTPDAAFRRWAENLPWWGEWVVALSSPNVLWTAVLALFLLAVLAGWRRRRRKYEALDD